MASTYAVYVPASLFFGAILSFLGGVFVAPYVSFVSMQTLGWSLAFCIATIIGVVLMQKEIFGSLLIFLVCGIFVFIGMYRFAGYSTVHNQRLFISYTQQVVTFNARVVSEADAREKVTHYIVQPDGSEEKIRITTDRTMHLRYGQSVAITGVLDVPEPFTNEQGITFHYDRFLAKDLIHYIMYKPQVRVLKEPPPSFIGFLYAIKTQATHALTFLLKEPHGALAAGILFGVKQALGQDLLTAFQRAGLIHIVVLSGYNVTIIADAVRRLFSFLPLLASSIVSTLFIITFALFTGGGATTVRASIMAIIAIVALQSNRTYVVHRALFLAALCMVALNPYILRDDPGFQLSFVATLGLLHVSPYFEKWLWWLPNVFELRTIMSSTIATQIAVLPLLLAMTGEISIISLVANIVVLPVIPLAMLTSFLSLITIYIGTWGTGLVLIAHWLLEYVVVLTTVLGNVSFATLTL